MPQANPQPITRPQAAHPRSPWRFLPLALILLGLAFAWAMGWHRYVSLAWLAESSDALQAHVDANYAVAAALFVGFYMWRRRFHFRRPPS